MELKPYQQRVITELGEFLSMLDATQRIDHAFNQCWTARGVTKMDAYKNNVAGVPHVCAKVPTAGGKTYIAVNALKTIFDAFHRRNPKRPAFVVWLVPSLTILDQTVKALSNTDHPYRKRLDNLFRKRVTIYEKKDLLQGAGFSLDTVREQLSIVVMSFDSLRARNKEDRKVFQDNGYLASFLNFEEEDNTEYLLADYDASALINVIRRLKPVVVVDESHNAESALSLEMLHNLNPHFIFDLTATPKNNSNIVSYVDAMQLKKYHMVKLPVIVANRKDKHEVIDAALILRRKLEEIAIAEEAQGGKHIRPIILFQAEPKTADDKQTFEKIKHALIALNIPEEQIKIKTANLNELKNVDLMARDCPVRYIITINALKEGWDCPNAYILAALGDKSSAVDVEQILGRILRMPHVQKHGNEMLNMSYVFTASARFSETLESVVKALNRAGFSDRDCRSLTAEQIDALQLSANPPQDGKTGDLFATQHHNGDSVAVSNSDTTENDDDIDITRITPNFALSDSATTSTDSVASMGSSSDNGFIAAITAEASAQNRAYDEVAQATSFDAVPIELESKMNRHRMKDVFRNEALQLRLPQFFIQVETGGWFDANDSQQLVERKLLLKNFKLANLDATINFEDVDNQMYRVDLEQIGAEEYSPKPFKIDHKGRLKFNNIILAQSREQQVVNLTSRLFDLIGNLYPIDDADAKRYITRIVEAMDGEQIRDCLERDIAYVKKIRQKIDSLANTHALKNFQDLLDVEKISIQPNFSFPENIAPSANAPAIPKSLYVTEASIGNFEQRVINDIANLENVQWWHRNLVRGKGFHINGFLNHYADFIIKTKAGRVIVLETKGDDRDNSDSEFKLKLGKLWEAKAGGSFKYMMVFENNPIYGAEKLSDALIKLGQL
ncbi:MAG: DEAD/DEAH box helicase family protein [Undibacterium sp.]|uniref:DEAD/DEAH box helicase n=1 Tax=Undibacterium sp. TaxID=1914977 RepID=UPI0027286291|nr:DEAD/DEAH box helicase family protein [Undibacterium sp.]MDO8651233.1 DEAD/DEAH box helicase family protein [Undibacterium sp.]